MVKLFSWRKDVNRSTEWSARKSFTISLKKDPEPAAESEAESEIEQERREDDAQ